MMILELSGTRAAAFEFVADVAPLGWALHFETEGDMSEQVTVGLNFFDGPADVSVDAQSSVLRDVETFCSARDLRIASHGSTSQNFHVEWPVIDYHISMPVVPGAIIRSLPHSLDEEIAWDDLRLLAGCPELSKKLQNARGELYAADADWGLVQRDFSGFVRQAETYYRAARQTRDATASLLYYYAFLNLAKAELLQWKPEIIHGQTPGHGFRYTPNLNQMTEWKLNIRERGIFPAFYEKRVGAPYSGPSNVDFTEMAGRCYEISSELNDLLIPSKAAVGYFTVVTDANRSSARMLLQNFAAIEENDPARAVVLDAFSKLDHPRSRDVRRDFSLSSRAGVVGAQLLQRDRHEAIGIGPIEQGRFVSNLHIFEHCDGVLAELMGVVEAPRVDYDVVLTPSLSDQMLAPLPPSLSRYMAMFVVASLVRYQPGAIDPMYEPRQAWFVNAFVRQAAPLLLVEAASQIAETPVYFEPDRRS